MSERLSKRATGITGLDEITGGGLPAAGATLAVGGPGAGKTVLGLQILAHALERGEAGVFVSFEESSQQVARGAASFDWGERLSASDSLAVLDARPMEDVETAGSFDLEGLLAAIGVRADALAASWVVLDGIDRLMRLQPDPNTAIEQLARLNGWCEQRGLTLLLTGKRHAAASLQPLQLEGLEFMLATVFVLSAELVGRRLNRRFRIAKYRGTAHETDEVAMVMDATGLHLPYGDTPAERAVEAANERISVGIGRLDEVLGGGVYRGSNTLVSGVPGTAKTSLAMSFAVAAAQRGERVLYLSFDELGDRIARNMASIGIDLQPHIDADRLHIVARDAWRFLVEEHYIEIHRLVERIHPDCVILDPVSALLKASSAEAAFLTSERLLGNLRARGITTLVTSLTEQAGPAAEATLSHASTLADTWITLEYRIHGGERNRALSVVKSRGTAHSNQVRELLLSTAGLDLADVYQYGSEVLMGTARLQKESEEAERSRRVDLERDQRRQDLERQAEQARLQMRQAENEAQRLDEALARERDAEAAQDAETQQHHSHVLRRRHYDQAAAGGNEPVTPPSGDDP
jgi:circadian clock protein KaiC